MLLRLTAQRQKKKNCNYRRQFRKSVQPFHAKEVCPTFWDRPPSVAAFSFSAFSLTTAMQTLRFDRESGGHFCSPLPDYSYCSFISLSFLRTMRQVISVAIINAITSPTAAKTYHGPKIGLGSPGNIAPNIIIASKRPYPSEVNISNIFNFLSKLIFLPPLWIGGKRCLPPM